MKQKRITLTIDQDRWLTAEACIAVDDENFLSSLRDHKSGLQCCLGFAAAKCGVTQARLNGKSLPNEARADAFTRNQGLKDIILDNQFAVKAASINDDNALTPAKRRRALTRVFAAKGVDLVFTGNVKNAVAKACKTYGASR